MKLLKGDCLDVLKTIPNKSIDMVICDLPYGITACKWDSIVDINQLWTELKRVGKENTPYFFFCSLKFGVSIINANPDMFRYDLVWAKNRLSNPLTTNSRFATAHENILVFYKKKPTYNYLQYHTKTPHNIARNRTNGFECRNKLTGSKAFNSNDSFIYDPPLPLSWLKYNNVAGNHTLHSTQKPVDLLEQIIKYYSNSGDIILDPTMGSGSIGIACHNTERDFIGIEKDPKIYDIAVKRFTDLSIHIDDV